MIGDKVHPKIGDEVRAWDHKFVWTSEHRTGDGYAPLKYTYDKAGDACIQTLSDLNLVQKGDFYSALRDNHHSHAQLHTFWEQVTTVPEWVDWASVARGQLVYYRYGVGVVPGLAYRSLLGATGSTPGPAETLSRTGGFDLSNVRKRLLETSQFVLQVTESPEAIRPGGSGFAAALRVRFLHAAVRKRILKLAAEKPSYYSVEQSGVPINDADSIETIANFSSSIIWQSLPRQGIHLRPEEVVDFLALWRLVAFYMGTPTEHFATPSAAKAIYESFLLYSYAPSRTSSRLARNIMHGLEHRPPFYQSRAMLEVNSRWLNGDELCDAMGIGRPPAAYWVLVAAQKLLGVLLTYPARFSPAYDRWLIARFRKLVWAAVLDKSIGGLGALSLFSLQYVPSLVRKEEDPDVRVPEREPEVFLTGDRIALGILGLWVFLLWFVGTLLAWMIPWLLG